MPGSSSPTTRFWCGIGGADQINGGARCTTGFPVEAEQIYGQTAVRLGDSGGPVYTYSAAGGVIAKGINSYTYNDYVLGFQDFGTAVMDYGIWIAS